ncbi:MAG: hypothetical protein ACK4SR_08815 [Thiobacillus sp.]
MTSFPQQNLAALIALLGIVLAFVAGVVPLYHVGYIVDGVVLAAVASPFVLYAMFITSLRGPWLIGMGLVLLGVTLAVVVDARYLSYDGYRDGTIYWVPLSTAAIALTVALSFGRRYPYAG